MKKVEKYVRPIWDEYYLDMLGKVAARATCDRGRSGCIITTPDHHVLTTGYVGAPPGMEHCDDVGHLLWTTIDDKKVKSEHCVRTLHAEMNAILQAALEGIPLEGATLYCNMEPCYNCAMAIVRIKIKRVICKKRYHKAERTREYFEKAGIELVVLKDEMEAYENM